MGACAATNFVSFSLSSSNIARTVSNRALESSVSTPVSKEAPSLFARVRASIGDDVLMGTPSGCSERGSDVQRVADVNNGRRSNHKSISTNDCRRIMSLVANKNSGIVWAANQKSFRVRVCVSVPFGFVFVFVFVFPLLVVWFVRSNERTKEFPVISSKCSSAVDRHVRKRAKK